MATFRFNRIKNDIPEGIVKWEPDEEAMSYGMDLSVEDRAKTDAAKRQLYADRILEKHSVTLDPDQDLQVVAAKIDAWLADNSTATTEEILADALSLLRDKGIV